MDAHLMKINCDMMLFSLRLLIALTGPVKDENVWVKDGGEERYVFFIGKLGNLER